MGCRAWGPYQHEGVEGCVSRRRQESRPAHNSHPTSQPGVGALVASTIHRTPEIKEKFKGAQVTAACICPAAVLSE